MKNSQFYILLIVAVLAPNLSILFGHSSSNAPQVTTTKLFAPPNAEQCKQTSTQVDYISLNDIENIVNAAVSQLLTQAKPYALAATSYSGSKEYEIYRSTNSLAGKAKPMFQFELENNLLQSHVIVDEIIASGVLTPEANEKLMHVLAGMPIKEYEVVAQKFLDALRNNQIDISQQMPIF